MEKAEEKLLSLKGTNPHQRFALFDFDELPYVNNNSEDMKAIAELVTLLKLLDILCSLSYSGQSPDWIPKPPSSLQTLNSIKLRDVRSLSCFQC